MTWRHYRIGPSIYRYQVFYTPSLELAFDAARRVFGNANLICHGSHK